MAVVGRNTRQDAVQGPILTLTGVGGCNKASDQPPDDLLSTAR